MSYADLDQTVNDWLRHISPAPPSRTIRPSSNYLDVYSVTERFVGTIAIHYSDILLTTPLPFPSDKMDRAVRHVARGQGFTPHEISKRQMTDLRACISVPVMTVDKLKLAIRFRRSLGHLSETFPPLNHSNPLVNLARTINAFGHRGRCRVAMVVEGPNGPRISSLFGHEDEAVLSLMKLQDPSRTTLLEI